MTVVRAMEKHNPTYTEEIARVIGKHQPYVWFSVQSLIEEGYLKKVHFKEKRGKGRRPIYIRINQED